MKSGASEVDFYKSQAQSKYFELLALLGDEKTIAKALAPHYHRTYYTIQRNLQRFAFKNIKSTKNFLNAAEKIIFELQNTKICARALLIVGNDVSNIVLIEKAKNVIASGINVVVPQVFIPSFSTQFWEYVEADINFIDFIIIHSLKKQDYVYVKAMAEKNKLMVFDSNEIKEIRYHSIQTTIKKENNSGLKN